MGEELEARPELVVVADARVAGALLEEESGVEFCESPLGDRGTLEALQNGGERGVSAGGNGAPDVARETHVLLGAQQIGAVVIESTAAEG